MNYSRSSQLRLSSNLLALGTLHFVCGQAHAEAHPQPSCGKNTLLDTLCGALEYAKKIQTSGAGPKIQRGLPARLRSSSWRLTSMRNS